MKTESVLVLDYQATKTYRGMKVRAHYEYCKQT